MLHCTCRRSARGECADKLHGHAGRPGACCCQRQQAGGQVSIAARSGAGPFLAATWRGPGGGRFRGSRCQQRLDSRWRRRFRRASLANIIIKLGAGTHFKILLSCLSKVRQAAASLAQGSDAEGISACLRDEMALLKDRWPLVCVLCRCSRFLPWLILLHIQMSRVSKPFEHFVVLLVQEAMVEQQRAASAWSSGHDPYDAGQVTISQGIPAASENANCHGEALPSHASSTW